MFRIATIAFCLSLLAPGIAAAQERDFTLSSPAELENSGFLRFLLPRFSLKTGIRVDVEGGSPELMISTTSGVPVMEGLGAIFYLQLGAVDTPRQQKAQRFADWLVSDIGKRTIEQFTVDGTPIFTAAEAVVAEESAMVFYGDATLGEALSYTHCGRCHVIGDRNRMNGIGSTPSFGLLRGLPDWRERFLTFHTRIPHPAIAQIEGVTEPFDPLRPPSTYPLMITVDQLEDILTYVSGIEAVDLGAPLVVHQ